MFIRKAPNKFLLSNFIKKFPRCAPYSKIKKKIEIIIQRETIKSYDIYIKILNIYRIIKDIKMTRKQTVIILTFQI